LLITGPPGLTDNSQAEYMMSQLIASFSASQKDSQSYPLYQSDQNDNHKKTLNDMFTSKTKLKISGDKMNPGKSCQHLFENNPNSKSGYYFIDPAQNGEPINVYCDITNQTSQTCIDPAQNTYNYYRISSNYDDIKKVKIFQTAIVLNS
jgi:hypothetical protein